MISWFKFYAADFLLDEKVAELPLEAQAILIRLWCVNLKSTLIPREVKIISKLSGVNVRMLTKYLPLLLQFFIETESGFYSERLRKEIEASEQKANVYKERGRKGGVAKAQKNSASSNSQAVLVSSHQAVLNSTITDTDTDTDITPPTPPCGGAGDGGGGDPLEAMLGGQNSRTFTRFYKLVELWPHDRRGSLKKVAETWLKACKTTDPRQIFAGAIAYQERFLPPIRDRDERRYMRNLPDWLKEESWWLATTDCDLLKPMAEACNA
jgi:uncharacterized protein YdaU (DUF1376 family)